MFRELALTLHTLLTILSNNSSLVISKEIKPIMCSFDILTAILSHSVVFQPPVLAAIVIMFHLATQYIRLSMSLKPVGTTSHSSVPSTLDFNLGKKSHTS